MRNSWRLLHTAFHSSDRRVEPARSSELMDRAMDVPIMNTNLSKKKEKSHKGVNEMGMQIHVCDYRFIKSAEEWMRPFWFTFKNSTVEKLNILAGWDDTGQVYRSVNLLLLQDKLILLTLTHYILNPHQNKCLGSPGEDQICNSKACEDKK